MATERRSSSIKTGDLELGRKIVARREELGLSRKQLAEATDLSYPYIAQIETGYRLPSTRHQVNLARVLGMSLDELFNTTDEPSLSTTQHPRPERPARRRRPSIDEVIRHATAEIESLPASVRLEALSQIQLRIMEGVTEERARRP